MPTSLSPALGYVRSPGDHLMNWLSIASELSSACERVAVTGRPFGVSHRIDSGNRVSNTFLQRSFTSSTLAPHQRFPKFINELGSGALIGHARRGRRDVCAAGGRDQGAAAVVSFSRAGDAGRGASPSSPGRRPKKERENV